MNPIHRALRHPAHRGVHLPVGFRHRQESHRRAVQPDPGHDQLPGGRALGLPAPHRLQLPAAHRQVPRQRLHQGRDEDGQRDPQDHGGRRALAVTATTVRVPVFFGHSEAGQRGDPSGPVPPDEVRGASGRPPRGQGGRRPGAEPLSAGDRRRRTGPDPGGPDPPGRIRAERDQPVDRGRQHPQGGRHQRRPDRPDPWRRRIL
ncbi:MAG: hypothetical protein MZV70_37560 [Desulfobacterales bacterium]|nr:hypothetical protein [Desulfobacterales bacterium]